LKNVLQANKVKSNQEKMTNNLRLKNIIKMIHTIKISKDRENVLKVDQDKGMDFRLDTKEELTKILDHVLMKKDINDKDQDLMIRIDIIKKESIGIKPNTTLVDDMLCRNNRIINFLFKYNIEY
jgi:hypothetical protein